MRLYIKVLKLIIKKYFYFFAIIQMQFNMFCFNEIRNRKMLKSEMLKKQKVLLEP